MNGKSLTFLYFTSSILRSKISYLIFDIGMWLKQHTITYYYNHDISSLKGFRENENLDQFRKMSFLSTL